MARSALPAAESIASHPTGVDRSGPYPVIRGVKLCGPVSGWKRRWLPEAFAGDKIKRYNNLPCHLDHGPTANGHARPVVRPVESRIGWIENARHAPDGMPVGDLAINHGHRHADAILVAAEHKPDQWSLSHVAHYDGRPGAGGFFDVTDCFPLCVDIVSNAGTTKTAYEEAPPEGPPVPKSTARAVIDQFRGRLAPDRQKKVRKFLLAAEDDPGMAPLMDAPMDAPPDGSDPEQSVTDAMRTLVQAIFDQFQAGDLSLDDAVAKFKDFLQAHAGPDAAGGDAGDADGTTPAGDPDKPASESAPGPARASRPPATPPPRSSGCAGRSATRG